MSSLQKKESEANCSCSGFITRRVTCSLQASIYQHRCRLFWPNLVKRGQVTEKRWGCIFSCRTTRAVHMEVVGSLSTDSFIMALRRFRGRDSPFRQRIRTNFVGANRELGKALRSSILERITGELAKKGLPGISTRCHSHTWEGYLSQWSSRSKQL